MTWILGQRGLIHYEATWTNPGDVENALKGALSDLERRAKDQLLPYHSERLKWRKRDEARLRARLELNGPQAVTDFYGTLSCPAFGRERKGAATARTRRRGAATRR